MLVLDFFSAGGSHSGSLSELAISPKGWGDKAAFFPLTRSEKSSALTLRRAPSGPKKPVSTTTYSSVESGPCGVAMECPVNSAATVTVPAWACAWYSVGETRGGMPFDSPAGASLAGAVCACAHRQSAVTQMPHFNARKSRISASKLS